MHRFEREYDQVARERLMPRAREMRLVPTRCEEMLWQAIRANAFGVRFRRQVILGPVIVDFFAPSAMLVVEIDGGVHEWRRDADRIRDEALGRRGIRVLRIDAQLVEARVDRAVALVRCALGR
jgi:very-short-patch-repair endonuclease